MKRTYEKIGKIEEQRDANRLEGRIFEDKDAGFLVVFVQIGPSVWALIDCSGNRWVDPVDIKGVAQMLEPFRLTKLTTMRFR
jgi:hypothetical protein